MNWTQQTDGQLVGAFASSGAEEAFAELIRRHASMVFRTCRRVTASHQDAEDATQAVFATVIGKAHDLSTCPSLGGWLYSAAWQVSRRYRRSNLTRRQRERHATPVMSVPGEERDPELVHELYRALEMLPMEYREAVVLHHLEGCTVQQVADVMECSVGTTAARLSRARTMMRERLSWRGVIMTDALIAEFILDDLLREPVCDATAARAAMAGTASAATEAATAIAATTASRAIGGAGMSIKSGMGSGVALYAGLRATQWVAIACVSVAISGTATAIVTTSIPDARKRSRMTESASASRSNTAAGVDDTIGLRGRDTSSNTSRVPEPSCVGLLALGGLLTRRTRRRQPR
jgi:RNA polymerase sigma factor (sigma-70 family)